MRGGGVEEIFVGGASFFCEDLPEPRALAALANIAVIFERDGGEEGRRTGVLSLDPAGAFSKGAGAFSKGAGGRTGSSLVCVDLDASLTASKEGGEGAGEALAGETRPPTPEDKGGPVITGVADTTRKEDTQ